MEVEKEEEAKLKVVGAVGGVHTMRAAVRATVGAVVATGHVPCCVPWHVPCCVPCCVPSLITWHLPSLVAWLLPSSPAPCGVADVLPASCALETVADDVASGTLDVVASMACGSDVVACMACGSAACIALAMPSCATPSMLSTCATPLGATALGVLRCARGATGLVPLRLGAPDSRCGACVLGVDCMYSVESDGAVASAAGVECDIAAAAAVHVQQSICRCCI